MAVKVSSLALGFLALCASVTPLLTAPLASGLPHGGRLLAASDCLAPDTLNNACLACNSLYYPQAGNPNTCLPITEPNCGFSLGQADLCDSCKIGWAFDNSHVCVFQPCLDLDAGSGLCNYCISLMYPNPVTGGDLCLNIAATDCTSSDGFLNGCVICNSGFYLSGGNCLPQSLPNCLAYKPNQNWCTSCASPYFLRINSCKALNSANCVIYNSVRNTCQKCASGYYYFDGGCEAYIDPNCSSFITFGRLCPLCNNGYYADTSAKRCRPQTVNNCQTYTTNTNTCTLCNDNSAPVSNVCP